MGKLARGLAAAFGFAALGALFFSASQASAVGEDSAIPLCAGTTCGPDCSGVLVSCNCNGSGHCDLCCSK